MFLDCHSKYLGVRFPPAQADLVAEPELPKEPEASCSVGTIALGISNRSCISFLIWWGRLGCWETEYLDDCT